jgi:hypothetical protein
MTTTSSALVFILGTLAVQSCRLEVPRSLTHETWLRKNVGMMQAHQKQSKGLTSLRKFFSDNMFLWFDLFLTFLAILCLRSWFYSCAAQIKQSASQRIKGHNEITIKFCKSTIKALKKIQGLLFRETKSTSLVDFAIFSVRKLKIPALIFRSWISG